MNRAELIDQLQKRKENGASVNLPLAAILFILESDDEDRHISELLGYTQARLLLEQVQILWSHPGSEELAEMADLAWWSRYYLTFGILIRAQQRDLNLLTDPEKSELEQGIQGYRQLELDYLNFERRRPKPAGNTRFNGSLL
jgi:hypothetical protein